MPASLLKNVLLLKDVPLPRIILVTDDVGVCGEVVVEQLLAQLLKQSYHIHYVLASPFYHGRTFRLECSELQYHCTDFIEYGNDSCPLENVLLQLRREDTQTPPPVTAVSRLTLLDSAELHRLSNSGAVAAPVAVPRQTGNMDNASSNIKNADVTYQNSLERKHCSSATSDSSERLISSTDKHTDLSFTSNNLNSVHSALSTNTCDDNSELKNNIKMGCFAGNDSMDHSITTSRVGSGIKKNNGDRKVAVIIDKVEDILLEKSARQFFAEITELKHVNVLVVLWCGRDITHSRIVAALEHIADATLALFALPPPADSTAWQGVVKSTITCQTGKFSHMCERFRISADAGVITTELSPEPDISKYSCFEDDFAPDTTAGDGKEGTFAINNNLHTSLAGTAKETTVGSKLGVSIEKTNEIENTDVDKILSAQTTFSLTLTEAQRRAKNNLELPHTRAQEGGGVGMVVYTPDREDWDEEDPDDDLDI